MPKLYTATASTNQGGRAGGHAETDDGRVKVDLAYPKEMGGKGDGTNPEQLVALGYSACFAGAVGAVAHSTKQDITGLNVTVHATISKDGDDFSLAFEVEATLPKLTQADAEALVAKAHAVCPYSRAFKNGAPSVAKGVGGA